MSGRGKRDHWSTKDDPFSISEQPGRGSPSMGHGAHLTGLLINLRDDDNGPQTSGNAPTPATAPPAPELMDTDESGTYGTQQQFQGQPQNQHGAPEGHIYPSLKNPEIGGQHNYHQANVMSKMRASSTHAIGNNVQQHSPIPWTSGNSDPSAIFTNQRRALMAHTHQGGTPVMNQSTYSGGTGVSTLPATGPGHHQRLGSRTSNPYSSDDEEKSRPSSIGMRQAPCSRPSSQQTMPVVKSMDELSDIGQWVLLQRGDTMHEIIATYVRNGIDLENSGGHVQLHQICQLTSGWEFSLTKSNKMLLWYKTTPGGINYLKRKSDGCIAFYDRIARAFPVKPEELKQPLRQIILLCTVALGKSKDSDQGYRHWSDKVLPPSKNSIKGVGRLEPDSKGNVRTYLQTLQGEITIPCGKTITSTKNQNCELEYSEYLVFQANRIKVEYAVDVEIIPK